MTDDEQREYYDKIVALRRRFRLGFVVNPGGGELTFPGLAYPENRCQVWLEDFKDDYEAIVEWLRSLGEDV